MTRALARNAAKRELYNSGWVTPLQRGRFRGLGNVFRTYSWG